MAGEGLDRYERQLRGLLAAYPQAFRDDLGESLVATLRSEAPADATRLSLSTAAVMVASGLRARAHDARVRGVWSGFLGGAAMTSTPALALQAAVSVAAAVSLVRYGAIFYLLDQSHQSYSVGAQYVGTWIGVALAAVAAFVTSILGWRWTAAALSLLGTTYLFIVAALMAYGDHQAYIFGFSGGIYSIRYDNLIATPGLLCIAALATTTSLVAAFRGRRYSRRPFLYWHWLVVGGGGLAILLSAVGDGNALLGSPPSINPFLLPNGGIMDAFEYLWIAALLVVLLWIWLDPRLGWVMAFLTVPVLAYSVSILLIASDIRYSYGASARWSLYAQMIEVGVAAISVIGLASFQSRRLATEHG